MSSLFGSLQEIVVVVNIGIDRIGMGIEVYPSNICQGDGLCRPNHSPLL